MGTRIVELELANFRGIDELKLSFRDPLGRPSPLVVVGGPNGSGKTSVLEAVLIATGHEALCRGPIREAAIRNGSDDFLIRAQFEEGATLNNGVSCNSTTLNQSLPQVRVAYISSWREPKLVGPLGITVGKKGRRPAPTEVNRLWRLKQFLIDARAIDLFEKQRVEGQLDMFEKLGNAEPSPYEYAIQRLHVVWRLFYSDSKFSVEPVDRSPEAGFDLYWLRSGQARISVDRLSSGQLELLQLCADFLVVSDPIDILVIDEPELHLDPAWHTLVIRAIQELAPHTQLIVGTHSPEIYDSAMSFERHFLVADDDPRSKFWGRDSIPDASPALSQ